MDIFKNQKKLIHFSPAELIWIFVLGGTLLYVNECAALTLIMYVIGSIFLSMFVKKYNKNLNKKQ